jgi:hypothetical protein
MLWDCVTGRARHRLKGHTERVTCAAFSPDVTFLVSGSTDRTVRLWDVSNGTMRHAFEGLSHWAKHVAISPNAQLIAAAGRGRTVRLWNAHTYDELHAFEDLPDLRSLSFSPDGAYIETSIGAVPIPPSHLAGMTTVRLANATPLLCVRDQWLTCDSKRLLWLPYEYKSDAVATTGNTIALGLGSGEVIFLAFDFRKGRPWN